jgi:hypothetical protein
VTGAKLEESISGPCLHLARSAHTYTLSSSAITWQQDDPGEIEVWLEPSADKLDAFGVLPMAFLIVDSSSIWDPAMSFILGLLRCRRWGRSSLRQQRLATTTVFGCSFSEFICNFSFFQGWDVKFLF